MSIPKQSISGIFLLLLYSAIATHASAQHIEIKGRTISATNKVSLPYVNVIIPANGTGTISNDDGIFVLKLDGDRYSQDSVTFSCVGYTPKTISVNDAIKQPDLTVALNESTIVLKEVVVKPFTLGQLIDSISRHNHRVFSSPVKLNGYLREFVFTNAKCNEYSDALFEYYYAGDQKNSGQLKIIASRCEKAVKKNEKNQNFEAFVDSKVQPDRMFDYSMLAGMIKDHFSDKELDNYEYKIDEDDKNRERLITIYPANGSAKAYKLQFLLSADYTLRSYKLEIPAELLKNVKERSMFGIHGKLTTYIVEARYASGSNGIYPQYFRVLRNVKIYGRFMGVTIDQLTAQKSEFVITHVDTKDVRPFSKNEIYKKGNICDNGIAINTALLKNYNFIQPTKKDSLAISSINKDISAN